MQTLKQSAVSAEPQQLEDIFRLWGLAGLEKQKLQTRLDILLERVEDPIAARFVWERLSQNERAILYRVLAPAARGGARRDVTMKKVGLSEKNFEAAAASLQSRQLLWEDTAKIRSERYSYKPGSKSTTTYEDVNLLHPYAESMDALFASGKELFAEKSDRSQMTLGKILAAVKPADLSTTAGRYGLQPGDYFTNAELRGILEDQLGSPQSAYEALERLEPTTRGLFKWLCEQGGKVSVAALRQHTGYDDTTLYTTLHTFEEYVIAFDTFSAEQRLLFVPSDVFENLKRAATEKLSSPAAPSLATLAEPPQAIRDSMTTILYDLAIIVGATYQQAIEPTQAGNVPKRLASKIQPLLHGKPRIVSYEHEDRYLEMVFDIAQELDIVRLSNPQVESVKQRYEPARSLVEWSQLDVVEQTRRMLDKWVNSFRWIDILGLNYKQSDPFGYFWKPALGRGIILEYLKQCVPGQWYTIPSLLSVIWEKNPFDVRQSPYTRKADQRKTSAQHIKWLSAEGELYIGQLNSSLFEMGIVQLGYQQPQLPDADHPRNPDAFMITPLGAAALNLPLPDGAVTMPIGTADSSRPLVLQPNFEMLLLHFDPPTLYSLLPLTQVQQVDVVSRLTLTRNSALRGMEWGLDVDHMLAVLERRSQKDIPQNVVYTLRDWVKLYKDAHVSQVLMLEVSSEAVADELVASPKLKACELRKLAPRVLVAPGNISVQELRRVIEKEGVIVRLNGDMITPQNRYSLANAGKQR